jgi:hypothetical protein
MTTKGREREGRLQGGRGKDCMRGESGLNGGKEERED